VRYTSVLEPSPENLLSFRHVPDMSQYMENNQHITEKRPEDVKIIDNFQDAEHALKFILSQPVAAAYGGIKATFHSKNTKTAKQQNP
jgi:hypothetical protein